MATGDIDAVTQTLANISINKECKLSFAGRGLKLDVEEDAKEIVEAIKSATQLDVLELKGNTLGIGAAKVIGIALSKHSEFKRALWSDMFTGRLKTEIPDALKFLCRGMMNANACLFELDLSDNAFGPNGMIGLMDFLKSSTCYTLQQLRLNNNGLGPEGGKMLADCLFDCYTSSVKDGRPLSLKVFVSGRGRLEDEGAIALASVFKKIKSLEEVSMPQNGINHEGITALAEAFLLNRNLRDINLSDNTFTEKGSISMAQIIPSLDELEILNFEDCLIRPTGAKTLATALKGRNRKLRVLKLSGNEINRSGSLSIAEAMVDKTCLELLDLNGNQLGEDGIENIRSFMEEHNKSNQLASFSEDEGTESEDEDLVDEEERSENEEHEEEVNEDEEKDDDEGEEVVDAGLEIRGQGITPRPDGKKDSNLADEMLKLTL